MDKAAAACAEKPPTPPSPGMECTDRFETGTPDHPPHGQMRSASRLTSLGNFRVHSLHLVDVPLKTAAFGQGKRGGPHACTKLRSSEFEQSFAECRGVIRLFNHAAFEPVSE